MVSAPAAGITRRSSSNPISLILKSIFGLFIGILIILLLAPTVLWFAESQNTAKTFSHSKDVLSTSGATGYIRTIDIGKSISPMNCYENKVEGNCLYYHYKLEELQYAVKDYCGDLSSNQKIIVTKGQECHRDSNDEEVCEQCYSVNESNWNIVKEEIKYQSFSIGNFKVNDPIYATFIGSEEYNKQIDENHKEIMSYVKDGSRLLVSGSSDGSVISYGGKKKNLIISTKDYQSTYEYLKSRDRFIAWILRIVTFIILLIGYNLIFGPISVLSNFVRKIPFIGRFIDNAVDSIIFIVSLILAIIHFIVLWVLIMIIKNIVWIAIIVAVAIGLFYLYTYLKKR